MLKEMGNQNATAITEAPENPSNENTTEENQTKNDQLNSTDGTQESADHDQEDQTLDQIKNQDQYNEGRGINSVEAISDETPEIENPASAIKDDDVEDQEIKDTTLNLVSGVSHESYALVALDVKSDDHVLEMIKEDVSLQVSEESTATFSSIEEERVSVINAVNEGDCSSNVSHNQGAEDDESIKEGIDEIEIAREFEDQIEDDDEEEEKFYEFAAKSEEKEDFKDLEMVNAKDATDCNVPNGSLDAETEQFDEGKSSQHSNVSDLKDLEVVEVNSNGSLDAETEHFDEGKSSQHSNASDFKDLQVVVDVNSGIGTIPDNHNTPSQINKSSSFNFEFKNSVTITEESNQTPLLYNNNNNKAPMRSLSTPATARFSDESADQERTINTVDYDQKPRTPLNGLLKDHEEETHLHKPQKTQQDTENIELCNGNGVQIPLQQGSRDQKRNKPSRNSGSYLFSSCICCSGVQELADP